MSLCKLISDYSAFNEWANQGIIDSLGLHDPSFLYAETPSSFRSIEETLQHIFLSQKFWLKFITNEEVKNFDWDISPGEAGNLMDELMTISDQMKTVFSSYSEVELLQTLHLDMPWARNNLSRYEYMMHAINHSTFHRGQIVTMGRSLGMTEGWTNTDYNIFKSELRNEG